MELSEGTSVAVSPPSNDIDLLPYLGFFFQSLTLFKLGGNAPIQ